MLTGRPGCSKRRRRGARRRTSDSSRCENACACSRQAAEAMRLLTGHWSTRKMTAYSPMWAQIYCFLCLRGGNDAVGEVEEIVLGRSKLSTTRAICRTAWRFEA
jgi:hypothetical protein